MSVFPTVPGLRLESLIGTGGMGAVYAAMDERIGRQVAVKILLESHTEASRTRFEREARAMLALHHPNIARAFDYGALEDGRLYIVMELMEGEDLAAHLELEGRLPLAEVVRIGRAAASGLVAAHRVGLVHRDIKPSNLFLQASGDGPPIIKVLDFGLAVSSLGGEGAHTRVTNTGEVVGTPAYMAPEQARGQRDIDERTDLYSLGAVLYHALTGWPPMGSGSALEILVRLLTEEVTPIAELRPEAPAALAELVQSCLSREPAERPESAAAFESLLAAQQTAACLADNAAVGEDVMVGMPIGKTTLRDEQRVMTVLLAGGVSDTAQMVASIRGFGGDATIVGDHVVGLFGGDVSEGDEAERAVRAAMRAEGNATVIGIGSGRAVGGAGHFAGDAFAAAEAVTIQMGGGIVLDEETQRRVAGKVTLESAASVPDDDEDSQSAPATPLIGRGPELSELQGHVDRAFEDEEAVLVLVEGPPGIGKTRLLLELTSRIADQDTEAVILTAGGDSSQRFHGWWLVATALRRWAGLAADAQPDAVRTRMDGVAASWGLSTDHGPLLAGILGADLLDGLSPALDAARRDAHLLRDRFVQAVGDLLEAILEKQPVLLLIDDVQWADAPTLELVEILARRLDETRFAIVVGARAHARTERPELLGAASFRRMELRELTRKAAGRLVSAVGLEGKLAEQVAAHVGGNPLFLEEIARAVAGGQYDSKVTASFRLPITVEEAIQARLDHLAATDKDLVKRASVFGVCFWREGIEALGVNRPERILDRLKRSRLISPAKGAGSSAALDEYRFRGGLVREVAYGMLTDRQRRTLHLQAGRWLAGVTSSDPGACADHLTRGGDRAAAVPFWLQAGSRAQRDGDFAVAVSALNSAFDCAQSTQREAAVRLARMEVSFHVFDLEAAWADIAAVTSMRGTLTEMEEAWLGYWTGVSQLWKQEHRQASETLGAVAATYERIGDSTWQARALGQQAVAARQGRLAGSAELALRAIEVAGTDPLARARALQVRQFVDSMSGEFRISKPLALEALEACEAAGSLRRALDLAITVASCDRCLGAHGDAERRLRDIAQKAQSIGYGYAEGFAWANLGYVLHLQGRDEDATEAFDRARTFAGESWSTRLDLATELYQLLARVNTGDATVLETGKRCLELTIATADEAPARVVYAMALRLAGRGSEGLEQVEQAERLRQSEGGLSDFEMELFATWGALLADEGRHAEANQALVAGRALLVGYAADLGLEGDARARFLNATGARAALMASTAEEGTSP